MSTAGCVTAGAQHSLASTLAFSSLKQTPLRDAKAGRAFSLAKLSQRACINPALTPNVKQVADLSRNRDIDASPLLSIARSHIRDRDRSFEDPLLRSPLPGSDYITSSPESETLTRALLRK